MSCEHSVLFYRKINNLIIHSEEQKLGCDCDFDLELLIKRILEKLEEIYI